MTTTNIAGIALIAGFVLVIVASVLAPPGLYSRKNRSRRREIIEERAGRWQASNYTWIVGSTATALGMLLLAVGIWEPTTGTLLGAGALAFTVASAAWVLSLYRRTVDPAGERLAPLPIALTPIYLWGTLASLGLYGLAFLQGSFADWPGLVYVVEMGVVGAGMAIYREQFVAAFPPQVFYLLTLMAGVMALRL